MPKNYGTPFLRLTFSGTHFTAEKWSASLNVIEFPGAALLPTVEQLGQVRAAWLARFHTGGVIGNQSNFEQVKAAVIGADGLYGTGNAIVAAQPLSGSSGTTASTFPPQVALAVTLLGATPRGPAGKGRFYLPAPTGAMGGDGRLAQVAVAKAADAAANFINDVNGILLGEVGIVGPETATGRAPARSVVRGVRVGRVLDTIRSRRSSLPEEPIMATIAVNAT